MYNKVTPLLADGLYREQSLCIRPSLPQPPVGGPGSPELALDDLEARSTLPGAACSMSQEPYDLSAGRTNLAEPPFFGGFFLFYMKCAMGRHETSLETVEIPPGR